MKTFIIFLGIFFLAEAKYNLPQEWITDIHSHKDDVKKIIDYVRGAGKHRTWKKLANFTDKFGHRIIGTQVLEDSIDHILEKMSEEQFDNVHGENITAPYWRRGNESCEMILPRYKKMSILAFGSSEGTGPGGIEANVLVVNDYDELNARKAEVPGKIVVFNQEWKGYPDTVRYRYESAWRTAAFGGLAALIRSMTHYSVYTPHTGIQAYNESISTKIPSIAITVEDAKMFDRMQERGETIRIRLYSEAENVNNNSISRNIVADITGEEKPHELVIFGGHIDSWDVGTGAMDDAGGCFISWEALSIIKELGLKPKRTMRVVMWSAEEIGLVGSNQFYDRHKDNEGNMSVVMESDYGTFKPLGIGFSGASLAKGIIHEILSLMEEYKVDATQVVEPGTEPDTEIWHTNNGTPVAGLYNDNKDYFIYHHTDADTIEVEDPDDLDLCTIVWTVTTYVIANLHDKLPRKGQAEYISTTPRPSAAPPAGVSLTLFIASLILFQIARK